MQLHKLPGTPPQFFAKLRKLARLFTAIITNKQVKKKETYKIGFRSTQYTSGKKSVETHTGKYLKTSQRKKQFYCIRAFLQAIGGCQGGQTLHLPLGAFSFFAWYPAFLALALSSGAHLAPRAPPSKGLVCVSHKHIFSKWKCHITNEPQ